MKLPSTFIVVDDDPGNNLICKYIIGSIAPDASIHLFTNPEKALEWIKEDYNNSAQDQHAALFLDINMPVMNGWEFLDTFCSFPSLVQEQITIFILSSSIDPEDTQKAEKHPLVNGYYSKPLGRETINQIFSA
ncbi:response regulator [Dyadobacter sp. CY343]|uniref:response regulator n=1 Tax=Dyadobacter sp. CY343 TaxID=2907299 RepID=UPI001F446E61|nr:response regulator [Dyadobacter sp. CY343]MCE7063610.1 response regulator [Dyadobacter sp. CY343]